MSPQRQEQERRDTERDLDKNQRSEREPQGRGDQPGRNVRPEGRGPPEPQPKRESASEERMKGEPGTRGKKTGTVQG